MRKDTTDSTRMNKTDFPTEVTQARRVNSLWRDNLDVLVEQAVDSHVEYESQKENIDEVRPIPESACTDGPAYHRPVHNVIRRAIEKDEKVVLRRSFDNRCEKIVLSLFQSAH